MFAMVITLSLSAQTTVSQIDDNLYEMTIKNSNIWQRGTFKLVENITVNHGRWIMKIDGNLKMKGLYDNGKLVELTTYTSGNKKTYTLNELKIIRLERKIYKLENMLSLRD
jgi:hypothetical protein